MLASRSSRLVSFRRGKACWVIQVRWCGGFKYVRDKKDLYLQTPLFLVVRFKD